MRDYHESHYYFYFLFFLHKLFIVFFFSCTYFPTILCTIQAYAQWQSYLVLFTFCSFSNLMSSKQSPVHIADVKWCCTESRERPVRQKADADDFRTGEQPQNYLPKCLLSLRAAVVPGSQFLLKWL